MQQRHCSSSCYTAPVNNTTLCPKTHKPPPHFLHTPLLFPAGLLLVTTPSRKMTLGSSNWPMMEASVRKSRRFFSVAPGLRVLMATVISGRPGIRSLPLHTSPNSPAQRKPPHLRINTQGSLLALEIRNTSSEVRSCVKVEVAVLGSLWT